MAGEKKRTKRRRRGEWSVEKLPSGRFRAVGSKMVDVTQPDGTVERVRKKVTSPTFATEKEAYDWIAANRNRPAAVGTVGDWLDIWLPLHKSAAAPSTYAKNHDVVRRRIRPGLGSVKLRDLDRDTVRAWLGRIKATPSEVHQAAVTLRTILNEAVESNRLPFSPMDRLKLPGVHREEKKALTVEHVRSLVEAAGPLAGMILIHVDACLRPGELLGLKWKDFDGRTIDVRRAVCRITGRLKELKTRLSRRQVPLSDPTVAALGDPAGRDPESPMFPTATGKHWFPNHWTRFSFGPIKAKAAWDYVGLKEASAGLARCSLRRKCLIFTASCP